MKKVLFISFDVPYDTVGHAGGKTHNYYLKKVSQDEEFDTFLISFCIPRDIPKLDCDKYHIKNKIFCIKPSIRCKIYRGIINVGSRFNPWNRYAGMIPEYYVRKILGQLKRMRKQGYYPDIIILEWTSIVLLAPVIKKIYPDAKLIASEHDVSYLGYQRKYDYEEQSRIYHKWLAGVRYRTMYRRELQAVNLCDYVFPHNEKDGDILRKERVPEKKIHAIVPYYMDFTDAAWNGNTKNVIFFGAMSRPENYKSVIWFIEHVMPLLEGTGVVFQVIGGGPPKQLKNLESENVKILGFVEDVTPYFSNALCMAAPLVLGAGIKVKVLEAMSAGVPVLTNQIGIEGIEAEDREEYFYCERAEEYAECIKMLIKNRDMTEKISRNAKKFVREKFNMEKSAEQYLEILRTL